MKKKVTILLFLLCMFTLVGCNSSKIREDNRKAKEEEQRRKEEAKQQKEKKEENKVNSDALKFKEEYESLNGKKNSNGKEYRKLEIDEENVFVYASAGDIVKAVENKETFLVYFGFKSCPWCRSILPTLISVAKDKGVDKIYYVDIEDIRDIKELGKKDKVKTAKEGTKNYYKLLDLLSDVLSDYTLTNKKDEEIKTGEKRIYAPNVVAVVDGEAEELTTGISNKQKDAYSEITDEIKKDMKKDLGKVIDEYVETSTTCSAKGDEC